jgi:glycosyltransferase involved in cell wall biosynthesis
VTRPLGPPRLLLVTTVPLTIEAFLLPLVSRMRERGWEVDGLAAGLTAMPVSRSLDRAFDAAWSRDPVRSAFSAPSTLQTVRGLVRHRRYDVVHVHTPVAGFLTRLALRRVRGSTPRVIYTAHGFHFHPHGGRWANALAFALEWFAARWTDTLIVTNQHDLVEAQRLPIDAERVIHIPGVGIDTDFYDPALVSDEAIAAVRPSLGIPERAQLLLCVGELNRNKNQALLIRAVARMRRADSYLVLRGSGPGEPQLRRLINQLGMDERVRIIGRVDDLRPLIRASRAVVLVSQREGLPRSLMEAMSLDVPVIGSDIRGIRDLVRHDAGTLVPAGDVDALAATLDRVANEPAAFTAAARRGRERVIADHGLDAVLAAHERLYASR